MVKIFLVFTLKTMTIIVLLFGSYIAWHWYDVSSLQSFCGAVQMGGAKSELNALANESGIDTRYTNRDGVLAESGEEVLLVPAPSSIGEIVCLIKIKDGVVVSANMDP